MQNFVCIRAMTFDVAMMSSINSQSLHVSNYKNGEIYPSTTWSLHTLIRSVKTVATMHKYHIELSNTILTVLEKQAAW